VTPTVLLADDSAVVRAVLREQLTAHGFATFEAGDGEETIAICRRELPDIVLLDVDMPRLDGYQVLLALRRAERTRDIAVVFLTSRVQVADAAEGLRLGAHDYLRKPVDPIELLARVSAALRVKELQDELRRRNEELSIASRTDVVTGLYNRRHLDELLPELAAMSRQTGESMAVIMIDIDHFKAVNDTYGHVCGDDSLRAVAVALRRTMRDAEILGRWGGEEFLALLPSAELAQAQAVADRLRRTVEKTTIRTSDGRTLSLTVSIGCAAGVGDHHELLHQADSRLYEAKIAGRNTVRPARAPRPGHDRPPDRPWPSAN
jgi:two-component system cell cycle response regulator